MFYLIKDDYSAKISEEFISLIKEIKDIKTLDSSALSLIDSSFKKFTGISSGFANSVSEENLLEHIKKDGKIQGLHCAIISALLYEEGRLYDSAGNISEAAKRYFKGFSIILNIFTLELDCEIEGYETIAKNLAEAVETFDLIPEEQKKIFAYYNLTGAYSKAEDYLYNLLETEEEHSFAEKTLKQFYSDLLTKTDEELINGNLPRSEIVEALNELH